MSQLLADLTYEFRKHKEMADKAMAGLSDEQFARRPRTSTPWH